MAQYPAHHGVTGTKGRYTSDHHPEAQYYARQNQTKKALWELDNIHRTLYILDLIDDVSLRQSLQKALNRGEAYHRFRKSVAYVNCGKF